MKTQKVWGVGALLLSVIALTACQSSSNTSSTTDSAKTEQTESKQETGKYKIGDTITFKDQAEYTITKVEWTDERNEFDESNPEKVLKVTYNVKNLSEKDIPVGLDLDLFVAGKKWKAMRIPTPWDR